MRKIESISLHHRHLPSSQLQNPLPVRCAVQSITAANPRTPRPGWRTAPSGSPLCIPRGVPMLCLPAARCRPPLPAAPGAAARCCPRLPAGCGRRGAPAVWEGPIGRSQQIRTGRRHAGSAPSPAVLGGGLFLQLCFCTPPDPRAPSVVLCWSPDAAPQHGWVWVGGLVWHPPRSPPPPSSIFVQAGRGDGSPLLWERGILHASPQPSLAMWGCFAGKGGWYGGGKKNLGLALLGKRFPFPKCIEVRVLTSAACTNSLKKPMLAFV